MGLTIRERRELTLLRRIIADRLGHSYREAPHVTLHRHVEATALLALRARGDPARPSIEDVVIKACALAMQEHPAFNALFVDGFHELITEVNIGIAVDTDRGLIVPVLKDVDRLTLDEIATRRRELIERTRQWRHRRDDLEEGTFTISNLGPLGVDTFTPIINPPQVAILGIGRIREWPEGGAGPGPGSATISLSLSFDHRVLDGADGARFLHAISQRVKEPYLLLGETY